MASSSSFPSYPQSAVSPSSRSAASAAPPLRSKPSHNALSSPSRFEPPPSPEPQEGRRSPPQPSLRLPPPRIPGADRPDFLGDLDGQYGQGFTGEVTSYRTAPPPPLRRSPDHDSVRGVSPASNPSAHSPVTSSSLHVLMQGGKSRAPTSSSASPFLNAHAQAQAQQHRTAPEHLMTEGSHTSSEGLARYLASQNGSGSLANRPIYARRASTNHLLDSDTRGEPAVEGGSGHQPPPVRAKHLESGSSEGRASKHRPASSGMGSAATAAGGGVVNALGQLGGIVSRKGWDFVRTGVQNFGGGQPSSPGLPPRHRGHSATHSVTLGTASGTSFALASGSRTSLGADTNDATRRWLEAPEPTLGPNAAQVSGSAVTVGKVAGGGAARRSPQPFYQDTSESELQGIFGAPLRDVVLATRLGNRFASAAENASPSKKDPPHSRGLDLDALDLGSEFAMTDAFLTSDEPESSEHIPTSAQASGAKRSAVSREEARLRYLPCLVTRCVESLERWGSSEEGIYRLSGRSSHTAKLRAIFSVPPPAGDLQLVDIGPAELDLNSVCSVLKSFLRDLPEPLLTRDLGPKFDEACVRITGRPATGAAGLGPGGLSARMQSSTPGDPSASPVRATPPNIVISEKSSSANASSDPVEEAARQSEALANEVEAIVGQLPAPNWYTLRELALHFNSLVKPEVVKTTKMPLSNLCLVLSPTFGISGVLLRTFITHVDVIFDSSKPPPRDAELDGSFGPPSRPLSIFAPPLLHTNADNDKRGSTMTVRPTVPRRPSDMAAPRIDTSGFTKSSESLPSGVGPSLGYGRPTDKAMSSPSRPGFFTRAAKAASKHRRREASVSSGSAVDESVSSRSSSPFENAGYAPSAYKGFGGTSPMFDPSDLSDVQRISRKFARRGDSEGDTTIDDSVSLGSSTHSSATRDRGLLAAASASTSSLSSSLASPLSATVLTDDSPSDENPSPHMRKNSAMDRPRPLTRSTGNSIFPNGQAAVVVTRTRARSVRNGDAHAKPPLIAPKPAGLVVAARSPSSSISSSLSASAAAQNISPSPRTASSSSAAASGSASSLPPPSLRNSSPSSPVSVSESSAQTPSDLAPNTLLGGDWNNLRLAVERAGQGAPDVQQSRDVKANTAQEEAEERTLDLKERKRLLGLA